MGEELKQDVQEEQTDEPKEDVTGSNQNNKQTSFTQVEVNKIIAREKASWKRVQDKLIEDKEAEILSIRSSKEDAEKVVGELVKSLKTDLSIPDEDWEFMSEGKDVFAQYTFLAKKVEKSGKKEVPPTPPREGSGSTTPFTRQNKV